MIIFEKTDNPVFDARYIMFYARVEQNKVVQKVLNNLSEALAHHNRESVRQAKKRHYLNIQAQQKEQSVYFKAITTTL